MSSLRNFTRLMIFILFQLLISVSVLAGPVKFKGKCVVSVEADPTNLTDARGGKYSRREQVKQAEDRYRDKVWRELEARLGEGAFDHKTLAKAYLNSGARLRWRFGTPVDVMDIFGALIIRESVITNNYNKGVFFTDIYGAETLRDFKEMRLFMDSIPNESFRLSKEMLAEGHRRGSENALIWAQRFAKITKPLFGWLPAHKWLFQGGGNFRVRRSRLYDYNISRERLDNILNAYESLVEVGVFPKIENPKERALWQIQAKHPYLPSWMRKAIRPAAKGEGYDITLSYPSPKIIERAMDHIIEWVNRQMDLIDRNHPDAMDPIELAAISQYAMVYLHPYKDGNGRITKAVKNKILEKYGMPPDLRYGNSAWHDLDMKLGDFIAEVRFGIYYAVNRMARLDGAKPPSAVDAKLGLDVNNGEYRAWLDGTVGKQEAKDLRKLIAIKALPKFWKKVITVGGNKEIELVFRGSFFQDADGVVYTYNRNQNALFPISDWSSILYGQGGELFIKKTSAKEYNFRNPNRVFDQTIRDNTEFFAEITSGRKDPADVTVKPYEPLLEAQKANGGFGRLHLYEWQHEALIASLEPARDASTGRPLDPRKHPVAVLSPSRGNQVSPKRSGPTALQLAFSTNKPGEIGPGTVFGAYTLRRAYLLKLEIDLKENYPTLYETRAKALIEQARRDAFTAAQTLLGEFPQLIREIMTVAPGKGTHPALQGTKGAEYHAQARNHDLWKGLYGYAKMMEWFYPTYEAGIKNVDQRYTVAIRNIADGIHLKTLGIATEAQQAVFIKIIPGLARLFKKIDAEIKAANKEGRKMDSKKIDGFVSRFVAQKFANDYNADGTKKEDGRGEQRKQFRAFVNKIVNGVLTEYYSTRGLSQAQQRPFMDLFLHTVGVHPQIMKSTSVDPFYEWLLNGRDELKFFPGGVSFLYRVRIADEAVDAKFSPYTAQAEVVENAWLHPVKMFSRVKTKVSEDGLRLTEPGPEGKPQLSAFGSWTMDAINSSIQVPGNGKMVPAETPVFNQRYERVAP